MFSRIAPLVLAVTVTGLLAACSSGGGTTGSTTSSSNHLKGAPFIVGSIISLSGPSASSDSQYMPGIKAWADWTNAHGGIKGHPVDLISLDDASDPSTSATDAHQLVADHAIAIFDGTVYDSAWTQYVASQKIPIISGFGAGENKYQFADSANPAVAGVYGSYYSAKQAGGTSVAFVYCGTAACEQGLAAAKSTAEELGLKFAYSAGLSLTSPNYLATCLAIKAHGANIIVPYAAAQTNIELATNCAQQHMKFILGLSELNVTNQSFKTPALNGAVSEMPDFPFTDHSIPATREYQAAMKSYCNCIASSNYGVGEADAWTGGQLIAAAAALGHLTSSEQPTSAQVVTGLLSMHNETLGGIAPPLTFSGGADENTKITCFFVGKIENGTLTEPQGLRTSCLP